MNIGISNIAWEYAQEEEVFSILRDYEIKYLEIAPTKIENYKNYISLCEKYNLSIFCMQSLFYNTNLNIFKNFDESVQHIKNIINVAQYFGAETIVFGSPKNRISDGDNDKNIFLNFLEELENFIEKHSHRIKMNIESNPEIYGCNFLTNINDTHNLLKNKNFKNIGIHSCRFEPSCSEYTYQAIFKYGVFKGIILGIWRILRCNPFSKGGEDLLK